MSKALQDLRARIPSRSADANKYLMLAQLLALGWSFDEVWPLMHLSVKNHRPEKILPAMIAAAEINIRNEIPWFNNLVEALQNELPKVYVDDINAQNGIKTESSKVMYSDDDDDLDINSKDAILKGLKQQLKQTTDPKLKSDILIKIADLQQMKRDLDKDEKRHVLHVLPARCNSCPCFKFAKRTHPDIKTLEQ